MLKNKAIKSAHAAARYVEETDDYYGKEPGAKGEWLGKGAAALGLKGATHAAQLLALLQGRLPNGEQISQSFGKSAQRRAGWDFTFSPPKSVSIQALVAGDARVVDAHDRAVRDTLAYIERHADARRKEQGVSYREHTGKLVVAAYRHELSREADPQLHTHALVMNMTQRADGQWRALANERIFLNWRTFDAYYHAKLAENLQALGYELRKGRKSAFELAHISDAQNAVFSERSRQIDRNLASLGLTREQATNAQKEYATLAGRARKGSELDTAALRAAWLRQAKAAGIDLDGPVRGRSPAAPATPAAALMRRLGRLWRGQTAVADAAETPVPAAAEEGARRVVNFAIAHLSERDALIEEEELRTTAFQRAVGMAPIDAVEQELTKARQDGRLVNELALYRPAEDVGRSKQWREQQARQGGERGARRFADPFHEARRTLTRESWIRAVALKKGIDTAAATKLIDNAIGKGRLVRAAPRYTTPALQRMERRILQFAREGRAAAAPMLSAEQAQALLAPKGLNDGQRAAAQLVLTTRDQFVGIQGYAGVGKSHLLAKLVQAVQQEVASGARESGYQIVGVAPYASQNRALAELGLQSQTLTSFLSKPPQNLDARTLVILDEAGVVPVRQMEAFMALSRARGFRVVMAGDKEQTKAVEAGKPFNQLQDHGLATAWVTEIQRQSDAQLRAAVQYAAQGEIGASVATLAQHIVEEADDHSRYQRIASDYAALTSEERDATLIVAGTNEARREINAAVRARLGLEGQGERIATLNSLDLTRAEKSFVASYQPGNVIVPEKHYPSARLEAGTQYSVEAIDLGKNRLRVRDARGQQIEFNPVRYAALSVYETDRPELIAGDWVRVTRNDKTLGITNGERYQVKTVTPSAVLLAGDGREVALARAQPLYLQHAYASTVHSAQGLTVERVLIDANVKSLTSARDVYYVAISRARREARLYTDRADELAEAMGRVPRKTSALELRDPALERKIARYVAAREVQRQYQARHAARGSTRAPTPTSRASELGRSFTR